jgi:RNA polymerase sigma-70 factor, ECF subfamily
MNVTQEIPNVEEVEISRERVLVRQVKQGYRPAFTELIGMYQQTIFKLAYKFFRDRDDAMEIVQETFIRVYQSLDKFNENDPRTQFKNWVYRVAHNLCIDYYRKYKKQKAEMKDVFEHSEGLRSLSENPAASHVQEQFRQKLEQTVMKLPRRQKMIFTMKHYSGLKHHEIAEALDLSVGTIKSLYHRSIQTLKKALGAEQMPGI